MPFFKFKKNFIIFTLESAPCQKLYGKLYHPVSPLFIVLNFKNCQQNLYIKSNTPAWFISLYMHKPRHGAITTTIVLDAIGCSIASYREGWRKMTLNWPWVWQFLCTICKANAMLNINAWILLMCCILGCKSPLTIIWDVMKLYLMIQFE